MYLEQTNKSMDEVREHRPEQTSTYSTANDPDYDNESTNESEINQFDMEEDATTDSSPVDGHYSAEVKRWRLVVVLMLAVTSLAVITFTYIFLTRQEEEYFKKSFDTRAQSITDASSFYGQNLLKALDQLADAVTLQGMHHEDNWPLVTIEGFEILGAHARLDSLAEVVLYAPFVQQLQRGAWEDYSVLHQDWLSESYRLAEVTNKWFDSANVTTDHVPHDHTKHVHEDSIHSGHGQRLAQETSSQGDANGTTLVDEDNSHTSSQNTNLPQNSIPEKISTFQDNTLIEDTESSLYAPIWQISPPPIDPSIVNYNLLSSDTLEQAIDSMLESGSPYVFTGVTEPEHLFDSVMTETQHDGIHRHHTHTEHSGRKESFHPPHRYILAPVHKTFNDTTSKKIVGVVGLVISWGLFLTQILPDEYAGMYAILECTRSDQLFSFMVTGPNAEFLGQGDLHETRYDGMMHLIDFGATKMRIYPSEAYSKRFKSPKPEYLTALLAAAFIATGIVFAFYCYYEQRRQSRVVQRATRTNAIVESLFPSNVRERVLQDAEEQAARGHAEHGENRQDLLIKEDSKLKKFLGDQEDSPVETTKDSSTPIAELFPETTVMFGDLVGFTAWSSQREPTQVFTLLESVYGAFDKIAKKRRVFKVETVGDCYVAVAGLPDPRKDHAVVMARFAQDCRQTLDMTTKKLEIALGPETGDLAMRIGLHSGPVTGGVLRGERFRFQLFGDTMNTCSRVESNGRSSKILVSEETANQLRLAGKDHWLKKREEKIQAKGKGELQTYWVEPTKRQCSSRSTSFNSLRELEEGLNAFVEDVEDAEDEIIVDDEPGMSLFDDKLCRLITWNVEHLMRLLKKVAVRRISRGEPMMAPTDYKLAACEQETVLDEVKEIITLPKFKGSTEIDPSTIELDPALRDEVTGFIFNLGTSLYHDMPFHNFEHVSHVAMSVTKLLSRIVAPVDPTSVPSERLASTLHDHTYGITSDPLTQFACVFSAIIHDVDHQGVPNSQLMKENTELAEKYKEKSVAEQNAVDIAWDLLMDGPYATFRRTIYGTETEFQRFRQLVVNSVMATDIMDKDASKFRKARWNKAFSTEIPRNETHHDIVNRKATIVIEHLIQASDVAHTMQHWHVYRKWNQRLFTECYQAYLQGRADKDPSENWYQGELNFFDFYIIPLAKKLKDCGVFGVSSYEYLNFAEMNRHEWEERGDEVVEEMKNRAVAYIKEKAQQKRLSASGAS